MNNNIFVSAPADIKVSDYKFDFNSDNPALYVGTYKKYNEGSLFGAWLDLSKFDDVQEFFDVCRVLHKDEDDPEFMFQDYSGFPEAWYSECSMGEARFNLIQQYADLDDDEKDAFKAYCECKSVGLDEDVFDNFRDAYEGEFDSEEEFAEHVVDECGMLDSMPENIQMYFDYEAYARDLFLGDFKFWNGYVFRD
jgi:antirestriction protein